jgi:hypothetical protein
VLSQQIRVQQLRWISNQKAHLSNSIQSGLATAVVQPILGTDSVQQLFMYRRYQVSHFVAFVLILIASQVQRIQKNVELVIDHFKAERPSIRLFGRSVHHFPIPLRELGPSRVHQPHHTPGQSPDQILLDGSGFSMNRIVSSFWISIKSIRALTEMM